MTDSALPSWLDEHHPHDAECSAQQIHALLSLLGHGPKRVLDLGCGSGRVLVPLAQAGHHVLGLDRSREPLARCREALLKADATAELIEGDFLTCDWPQPLDAIVCLGNTFMTIADVQDAIGLMSRAAASLGRDGVFVIDDLPGELWAELTEGNWQAGVSEDGTAQMVWHATDCVFALRTGDAVDTDSWELTDSDRLFRLWTSSALSMACRLANLSEPAAQPGLLVMSPRA